MIRRKRQKRDVFYYLLASLRQWNQSSSFLNKSRCVGSELSDPQKRMWPLDCQTSFCLWSVWRPCFSCLGGNTQLLKVQIVPSFQAIETNKTKQNKNLSALLMPDDAILDPRRGRNCQTHLVPAGKHGVSLEQNFSPTLILTLSCPSSGLFLRVGPSSPPPLLSGHCPMVTRSFSWFWTYPNSCFQSRPLESCGIIQIVKKNLYLVHNFFKSHK